METPTPPTTTLKLTDRDREIILYALGTLTGTAGLDEERKLTHMAAEGLRLANKIINGG